MFRILGESDKLFATVAKVAFKVLKLKGKASVEALIVDEDEIKRINNKERNINEVTDVLSFPTLENIMPFCKKNYPFDYDKSQKAVCVGSVIICNARVRDQAKEYCHSENREKAYLFLHGLLHLMGYDHILESQKSIMRAKEEEILGILNILR